MKSLHQLARRTALSGFIAPRTAAFQTSAANRLWQRNFSVTATAASKLAGLDPSKLTVTKTTTPKELKPPQELVFGKTFTGKSATFPLRCLQAIQLLICTLFSFLDHMLSIEWTAQDGWRTPQIIPYQNLSLDPSTCVFHYAFECFEGMKAYKDNNGKIRLFRPDKNMERLNKSSSRIALPTVDGEALTKLIAQLVKVDSRFIPKSVGPFVE